MKNRRLYIFLMVIILLLLIPLIAMQFTNEVNWSVYDFAAMGVMLLGTAILIELTLRKVKNMRSRIFLCVLILVLLLLLWAELAVGILGSPIAGS